MSVSFVFCTYFRNYVDSLPVAHANLHHYSVNDCSENGAYYRITRLLCSMMLNMLSQTCHGCVSYFSPYYIQISLRSFIILYFSADCLNCAKFPSLKCTHISFWLNPMGHSKFHNTSIHPPPATDSGQTAHTSLYLPVQSVPHYSLPRLSRTEELAKASTYACDRHLLQQLALNVHIKHSDLT